MKWRDFTTLPLLFGNLYLGAMLESIGERNELSMRFWWSGNLTGNEFEEIMNIWESMTPSPNTVTKQKLWWLDYAKSSFVWNFTGTWGKNYFTSAFVSELTVEAAYWFIIPGQYSTMFFFANITKSSQQQISFAFGDAKYLISPRWSWNHTQDELEFAKGKKWMDDMNHLNIVLGSYLNYIDFQLTNWTKMYYGNNFAKLQKIKAQWDPFEYWKFPMSVPLPDQRSKK